MEYIIDELKFYLPPYILKVALKCVTGKQKQITMGTL